MVTRNDVVDAVYNTLYSHGVVMDRPGWLTSSVTNTDLTFQVNSGTNFSVGLAEVDDEMVWVDSVSGNALTLAPFGRGYQSTTAAAHSSNAKITSNPRVSRQSIVRTLANVVGRLYPTLYAVKTHDFVMNGVEWAYDIPADAEGILKVEWEPLANVDKIWPEVYMYQFDVNSGASATGKSLVLGQAPETGATVRVTYKAQFTPLATGATTLADAGMSDSCQDLLTFACASDHLRALEPARSRLQTVENVSRAQVVETGAAADAANSYYAMYQQRLAEERRSLLLRYPVSMKFQR